MKYCRMGRTGLYVSKICLGTANFGTGKSSGAGDWGIVNEKDACRIMDYALSVGINFFDTANVYGGRATRGLTEEIIGRWFAQGGGRREKIVLGTKVGRIFENSDLDGPNNVEGLSLYKIRRHVEASLRRLQSDHVELIQMHKHDAVTGWDEIWEAFEGLVRSGKVDYVGSSNHDAWQIMKAQECARKRNFMGLVNEQHLYTPLSRSAEMELLPMAKDQGIGITLFSPLFRGLLGINAFDTGRRPLNAESEKLFKRYRKQAEEFSQLCHSLGETEANVALAWELHRPEITSVITAPACIEDLESLLRCVDIVLSPEVIAEMDRIFPPLMDGNPYV